MDVKEIKRLIDLMVKNDLRELEIRNGDSRVVLKRGPGESAATLTLGQVQPVSVASTPVAEQLTGQKAPEKTAETAIEEKLESINSPMVGTFYQAPTPESDPFVQIGDTVNSDSAVCIIEAMKVMNEIKAGLTGTIEKVLVKNGEALEFGQPMFLVRPA